MIRFDLLPSYAVDTTEWRPWRGTSASFLLHAVAVAVLWSRPPQALPNKATPATVATQIIIDKKLYYVTPLTRDKAAPTQVRKAPDAPAVMAREATVPEPRPARIPAPFVPPNVRKDPKRTETIVQADLLTVNASPESNLPSLQAWTGRLSPYRREFVVPGQRNTPPARTLNLDTLPPPNPVVSSASLLPRDAKLHLAPAPTAVDEDLPAIEVPNSALNTGDAINVVTSTIRTVAPDKIIVPPDSVVARAGDNAPSPAPSNNPAPSATKPATTTAPGAAGNGGTSKAAPATASNAPASAAATAAPTATVAVQAAPAKPTAPAKDTVTQGPNGSTQIERSPQGRFDAIVVQSSPLDQFPSGSTLLRGRPIYTVYVPIGTAKDWTMYLSAQTDVANTQTAPLDPPYPYKLLRPKVSIPTYQKYVLVHGIVNETGETREVRVIPPVKQETADLIVAAVSQWTFRPAKRQGAAIATEFLLVIPAGTF